MKLPSEQFRTVVRDTVLVSLDLLILNDENEVLLGRRLNSPAKGFLFVPGGRIYKGEGPEAALRRISKQEVGIQFTARDTSLYGIYHHLYPDTFFGDLEIGATEYIVIACLLRWGGEKTFTHDSQHDGLRFIPVNTVPSHPEIHDITKAYFMEHPSNAFLFAHRQDI